MQLSLDFSKAVEIWKHKMPDGVANPPSGVSGEFVALLVVEFLRGTNQAETAFLNEVLEAQAPIHVFLGD